METEEKQEEIDIFEYIRRFFVILKKTWILVLILAVVCPGVCYFRAKRSFTAYYESKAIFSVSSGYAEQDIFTSSYYYDISAASQLVTSFPSMLNTDMMRDLIIAQLDKGYINGSIIPSSIAGTNLFELTVRSNNAQDAYDVLSAVIEAYPQVMVYSVDTPHLIIRQNPYLPENPINTFDGGSAVKKGLILGLALGILVTAAPAVLIRTIGNAEELKNAVNLPLLAVLPHVAQKKRRKETLSFLNAEDDPGLSEALRGLRTKLRKKLADKNGKIVLFTSTLPGEGKSTICANLALSLAADGSRVVLLDADLRNQSIHRIFGKGKPRNGLRECLNNPNLSPLDVMHQVEGSNLFYISGANTNKRHYGIDSKSMLRVIDVLDRNFDYVIVDSPPCSIVSDTATLCRFTDCIVYVVKQEYATRSRIRDSITNLYERELPLTGCVLNDVPRKTGYSYGGYGYGSYSGNRYGYGNKKKKK